MSPLSYFRHKTCMHTGIPRLWAQHVRKTHYIHIYWHTWCPHTGAGKWRMKLWVQKENTSYTHIDIHTHVQGNDVGPGKTAGTAFKENGYADTTFKLVSVGLRQVSYILRQCVHVCILYMYLYIYIVCKYVYIYIYIYTHTHIRHNVPANVYMLIHASIIYMLPCPSNTHWFKSHDIFSQMRMSYRYRVQIPRDRNSGEANPTDYQGPEVKTFPWNYNPSATWA